MSFLSSIFTARLRTPPGALVHYHIFKNAGSSTDRLLGTCFGDRWARFEGAHPSAVQTASDLRDFLTAHPSVRAVSTHLARPPLPSPHCAPIVMLRHPIDRARSVFQYVRRSREQPHHEFAQGSFADFVTWALDNPRAGVPMSNYQVFHLSDASFRPDNAALEARASDFIQARDLIASWPAFGLVRRFGESCQLFEACYRPLFPDLRLRNLRENASPDTAATDAQALDLAREELGDTVLSRLCNANLLDLALYDFACRQFDALVGSRTGAERDRSDLVSRLRHRQAPGRREPRW